MLEILLKLTKEGRFNTDKLVAFGQTPVLELVQPKIVKSIDYPANRICSSLTVVCTSTEQFSS